MIDFQNPLNANNFSQVIEKYVHERGMSYLEAIMWFCESNNIEVEAVASLLKKSDVIRMKLEAECENANMISRSKKLPL